MLSARSAYQVLISLMVQVNLKREKLELSPVYSTAVNHDGHKLGYIRLVNFGQHAALDMQHAVQKLQACPCFCLFVYLLCGGEGASTRGLG